MSAHTCRVISVQLAHAIASGATELKPSGGRLRPGRLVRIAMYRRCGLTRAAEHLGMSKQALADWLHRNGISSTENKSKLLPPPRQRARRKIGKPDTERIYLSGRR